MRTARRSARIAALGMGGAALAATVGLLAWTVLGTLRAGGAPSGGELLGIGASFALIAAATAPVAAGLGALGRGAFRHPLSALLAGTVIAALTTAVVLAPLTLAAGRDVDGVEAFLTAWGWLALQTLALLGPYLLPVGALGGLLVWAWLRRGRAEPGPSAADRDL